LQGGLRRAQLPAEPFSLFSLWQQQALESGLIDATAMVLATASAGQPSQRIVLLKGCDESGFVFYTNYHSRKAQEIQANANVSLLFPWHALERQVKIAGLVQQTTQAESAAYFASRPRDSQLAAWASPQSQPLQSREELQQRLQEVTERFDNQPVPLPANWGGYRVVPHEIEFWQGGAHRLHDCFRYSRQVDGVWKLNRIAP
jgi:pyridoxamine 5'-phosphate oxidase